MRHCVEGDWPPAKQVIKASMGGGGRGGGEKRDTLHTISDVLLARLHIHESKSSLPLYPTTILLTLTGKSNKHMGALKTGTQICFSLHLHPLLAIK